MLPVRGGGSKFTVKVVLLTAGPTVPTFLSRIFELCENQNLRELATIRAMIIWKSGAVSEGFRSWNSSGTRWSSRFISEKE